jgi:hypothetical protein
MQSKDIFFSAGLIAHSDPRSWYVQRTTSFSSLEKPYGSELKHPVRSTVPAVVLLKTAHAVAVFT